MTEGQLRILIGFYILLIQLLTIVQSTYYLTTGGFLFTHYTTIVGLIIPLFAGYVSIIVKYFISSRFKNSLSASQTVSVPYIVLSFAFPSALAVAIFFCVYAAAEGIVFRNFEDVKITIGLAQAAFGVYTGQIIYSLFEGIRETPPRKQRQ